MSIRQGKKLIASSTTNGFSLFDCKWADHILNNISWLRADTFSWQSGDVYVSAYEHLLDDWNATGDVATVDTIGEISIPYRLSADGHKICGPDHEATVSAIYEATGVAWYYILDVANKQFKLPRTKFGFTGIRSGVGKYVEAGLPNIEGYFGPVDDSTFVGAKSGAFYKGSSVSYDATSSGSGSGGRIAFDASLSDATYGRSETVQPRATEMYLYFYVGNYVENATTVDVGKLTEIVNDFDIETFKPEVDEAKNSAIVDISDAKTDAIDSLTNLATDLGSSLKYGNVGDIFYTSRLDVSLNGAVECNGNLYNTTDFSGAQSIGNLLRESKVPYISLSEHQTTIDTYGSCRCFGWDGGTEFRVPKLTDVFIEAGIAASEGEFITAGLPNITGYASFSANASGNYLTGIVNTGGALYGTGDVSSSQGGGGGNNHSGAKRLRIDASRSSSIYGNSTTVQPPAVRYRAMVQLAFGATDDAVVAAGGVVADVSALNSHRVIAFQVPTEANNYTWYRKYADGWVEQGGQATVAKQGANTSLATDVSLPIIMSNAAYLVNTTFITDGGNSTGLRLNQVGRNTTYITLFTFSTTAISNNYIMSWEVKGMCAR